MQKTATSTPHDVTGKIHKPNQHYALLQSYEKKSGGEDLVAPAMNSMLWNPMPLVRNAWERAELNHTSQRFGMLDARTFGFMEQMKSRKRKYLEMSQEDEPKQQDKLKQQDKPKQQASRNFFYLLYYLHCTNITLASLANRT